VSTGSSQIHNVSRDSSQIHNESIVSSQIHNESRESSQIHNVSRESSQIHNESRESSQIHNESTGSSQIHNEIRDSSQIHNVSRDSSQIHNASWESSQIHNESRESSQIHNESRDSSQIHNESRDSSQIYNIGYNQSVISVQNKVTSLRLFQFAVAIIPFGSKINIKKEKTCIIQKYKPQAYLQREGIEIKNKKVILFKRVSFENKTQEGTENEMIWEIGKTITHPNWNPAKEECNGGKYHVVSRPYFADEFRDKKEDKYIAIEIHTKDLYEWKKNPTYPHKIGFRAGKVLHEVNKYGNKSKKDK